MPRLTRDEDVYTALLEVLLRQPDLVPLPEPSTPSKAMNTPLDGARLSLGTSARGCGRPIRNREEATHREQRGENDHGAGDPEGDALAGQVDALIGDEDLTRPNDTREDREGGEGREEPET